MKRIFFSTLLIVTLIFALAACAPKKPANHLDAIKQAGTIKVGTSADYAPFESVDSSGNKVGFDIALMAEIAKRMGIKLEWVDMPFDSLIAGVQEGKIDAAISAFNYNAERAQKIDFTDPYFTSEDAYVVTDSFTGQIVNPEDIAKYKVGAQTGTTQDTWLTALVDKGTMPGENISRYDRVDQAAMDLKAGRIDVLMADYIPAQDLVKKLGGMKVIYHGVLSTGPVNIVVPKGDTALGAEFNKIIAQLKTEGFIDQLAQKYFISQ